MGLKSYRVGIVGCGKILPRHMEAIEKNDNFSLISVCDIEYEKIKNIKASRYINIEEMIDKENLNFIVVATPNSLHFEHAKIAIENNCDVLIEKPATLNPGDIDKLINLSNKYSQNVYTVLQVRLNSCVQKLKHLIDSKEIGDIRGFSLVQRWQRPKEYFYDWRGEPLVGGGILHECGIHYLDVLCYLLGKPDVLFSKKYNTKHKNVEIEDTIYSFLNYGSFGGITEVSIACEPHNIECSLTVLTDKGFIKLGGKAMNSIEGVEFVDKKMTDKIVSFFKTNDVVGSPNSYGSYSGSCPNHPDLYRRLDKFNIQETKNVLQLIDEIYSFCKLRYY